MMNRAFLATELAAFKAKYLTAVKTVGQIEGAISTLEQLIARIDEDDAALAAAAMRQMAGQDGDGLVDPV